MKWQLFRLPSRIVEVGVVRSIECIFVSIYISPKPIDVKHRSTTTIVERTPPSHPILVPSLIRCMRTIQTLLHRARSVCPPLIHNPIIYWHLCLVYIVSLSWRFRSKVYLTKRMDSQPPGYTTPPAKLSAAIDANDAMIIAESTDRIECTDIDGLHGKWQ